MSGLSESRLSRRRFLGLMGASAALASGCSKPGRGTIAASGSRPQGSVPGRPDFYATTFQEGSFSHGILVRAREGRPIHIQGNDRHPLSLGKAPLRAIADILRLYDPDRIRRPLVGGKPVSWAQGSESFLRVLHPAEPKDKGVLLLTGALLSPTTRMLVSRLSAAVPGLTHLAWEPSHDGSEDAALQECFGSRRKPRLRLDLCRVVLALEADLLSPDRPDEVARFASTRSPRDRKSGMSRLYSFESCMSLTGAKADHRFAWRPSRSAALAFALARALAAKGVPLPAGMDASSLAAFDLDALCRDGGVAPGLAAGLVKDLEAARGSVLAAAGPSLPPEAHAGAFLLNAMLGAEGTTVDASLSPEPPDLAGTEDLKAVLEKAAAGGFSSAVLWGANPAYAFPDSDLWKAAAHAIPNKAFIGLHVDETAQSCGVVLPEHHWLESWNDFEPSADLLSLQQPAIGPIFQTRQGEDILLSALAGLGKHAGPASYREFLMDRWRREVHPGASAVPFDRFWNACLHDGVLRRPASPKPPRRLDGRAVSAAAKKAASGSRDGAAFELALAPGPAVHDGRYANNGWLQELPDRVTKLTWGNAASVSPADASRLGLKTGDLVELTAGGLQVSLPVVVQPGQAPGTMGSSIGYGRGAGSVARGVGANLYPLMGAMGRLLVGVEARPCGRSADLPFSQRHAVLEEQGIVERLTLQGYAAGEKIHRPKTPRLIPELAFPGRKWAMAVDLGACVGCQSCVVACQSENNIPVVGPERVLKGREMHWIRVDRYYKGSPSSPQVLFEPMFCQQCDDAPCETVCPVAATNHSPEGLNQMAYNRCVGTRYCSNNCPYKVRRFNFFEYTAGIPETMALAFNPEVTVRPRGVMEKCTFCVQRIEEAKASAKAEGRKLKDGDIEPACAAACPARAIVFGDVNDPGSRVSAAFGSDRGFRVLEELGIKPSVTYLAGLANPAEDGKEHGG